MKRLWCILLSLIMILCFCACSEKTSIETVETVYDENGTSTLDDTLSNNNDSSSGDEISSNGSNTNPSESSTLQESRPNNDPQPDNTEDDVYHLSDASVLEKIKLNGRCEKLINGVGLGMSASAIEFNTSSTTIMIEADCADGIYYNVVVDGEITQNRAVTTNGTNYIFVRGLLKGEHNIKIIRDGEGRTDKYFIVKYLQFDDGELLEKDSDKPIVEFLGDSLTSGYGNLVTNGAAQPQELKNQSAMKAYPYLTALSLGFDYRIVSQSGIALGERDGYYAFLDYYHTENYHTNRNKKYTSSNPQDVDIVVVNLGTNDIGAKMYDATKAESVENYITLFTDLITKIGYTQDTKIIFVTGVWHREPITAINGAVKKLADLGYNNVYTLQLKECRSGGGAHPSGKEQQEIADALVKFIKEKGIA
ncbi:MAG: hypothetical protein IJE02_05420 [Clostridia bacterium]|nr:hypothetical protein [Clostridia bacterium]